MADTRSHKYKKKRKSAEPPEIKCLAQPFINSASGEMREEPLNVTALPEVGKGKSKIPPSFKQKIRSTLMKI